jgi:uncharacterized protein (DUF433 family)
MANIPRTAKPPKPRILANFFRPKKLSQASENRADRIENPGPVAAVTALPRIAPPLAFGRILSLTELMIPTAYRYIVSEAGVRGGHARVEGTRIGVHDVIAYFLLGSNLEEVAARFPDLSRAKIYECLAYYEDHRSEIESLALPQTEKTAA